MRDGTQPRLLGVLVTFRRPESLREMLDVLEAQTRKVDHLVVVDNSPTRKVRELVTQYSQRVGRPSTYVAAKSNLGPAGGIARGMNHLVALASDEDWILTLDDDNPPRDAKVFESLLAFAQQMVKSDPLTGGVAVGGSRFDLLRGQHQRIADGELTGPVLVDVVAGGQFPLYRAGAVRAVGPFAEELFFGFEELEYGLRMRTAGFGLYVDGPELLRHRESLGRLGRQPSAAWLVREPTWRRYYSVRNLIHIVRTYGTTGTAIRIGLSRGVFKPLLSLPVSPRNAWQSMILGTRANIDAWTRRMGRRVEPGSS